MKRPPCNICRTLKWTKTSLGFYVCANGHYLQGVTQEEADIDFKSGIRTSSKKKKEQEIRKKKEKVWFGDPVAFKYKAFQLALRHQIYVMIHHFGLPPEFEKIVQELWLLYVNTTNSKYDSTADLAEEVASTNEDIEFENEMLSEYGSDPEQDEVNELDAEVIVKMEPREEYDINTNPERVDPRSVDPRSVDPRSVDPRSKLLLQYSLVFIYLGCVWCRWPITIGDIHRWAFLGLLPFHNLEFPESMRQYYLIFFSKTLTINTFPSSKSVRKWTTTFVKLYRREYGLEFPEINGPLILSRYIHELLLPAELYYAADNLAHLLSLDYHLPAKSGDARWISGYPDIKLMAIVLIAVKSCYGLDDKNRRRSKEDGIFAQFPSKKSWLAELKNKYSEELTSEVPWETGKLNFFAESNLDGFLEFCRKNFTAEMQSKYTRQLRASLHVDHPPLHTSSRRVQTFMHTKELFAQPLSDLTEEPPVSKLGKDYIRYKVRGLNYEDPESYHEEYMQVLAAAAKILGSSIGSLQRMVKEAEGRVKILWPAIKKEPMEEPMEMEGATL